MRYFERLHPWCIIRPLPNLQRLIVARYRRRNDADSHLQILRQLTPDVFYEIVFDVTPDDIPDYVPLRYQFSRSRQKQK